MVGSEETSASYTMSTVSYDTALCVLPPVEQCEHVDSLRELYDKSFGRWPAHVNLVYPFVATECLPQAQQQIQAHFDKNINADTTRKVKLDSAALFKQRHNSTAIVQESPASSGRNLETLRSLALQALGRKSTPHNFHLTIGQTEDNSMSSLELLLSKTRYLPAINFEIGSLAILIRERTPGEQSANRMRLWGVIELAPSWAASTSTISEYWLKDTPTISTSEDQDDDEDGCSMSPTAFSRAAQPGKTFFFDQKKNKWVVTATTNQDNSEPSSLTVSSYNVLVDSEYPPERDRDPLLISTLLSSSAKADILVLQEVSDDFLATLLENANVQSEYPFTSHAPPTQSDIGPLPSLRNIVILSKYPFRWELVPFHRRHKGAVVAVFDSFVRGESLVVAGIHLTCGLTDGSVAAKKTQVQSLLRHLTQQYTDQPWVIAGDFNIVTSAYTIETALKNQSISSQTSVTLSNIESMLAGDGLLDAWSVAQVEHSIESYEVADELFDGEEGATFDPRNNLLATETSGTSQNRPQRYDRILIRPQETLRVVHFNMFGLPEDINGVNVVPSDHSGIRTSLQLLQHTEQLSLDHLEMLESLKMEPQHIPHLQNQALESVLSGHGMFLGVEEKSKRKAAFDLLKSVVLGTSHSVDISTAEIPMVMVTVGSYAMKVDTLHSDIDCLCIGTISSKTFFKLARQRLQKAESQGIRILRKVEASTGTMLELSVNGIPMDLQYCPAARIVER
jgi:endonuclease/exonuclease/phosphatase family metal-dependent hydrolase